MLEFSESQEPSLITATELCERCGESYRTIDYYSNQGLLKIFGRRGRTRLYREEDTLARIRTIRKLQNKGYPLTLIKDTLDGTVDN